MRWIHEMNVHQERRSRGDTSPFDREAFVDFVWKAPLGEGFGGM
jgi:hypothetical protein